MEVIVARRVFSVASAPAAALAVGGCGPLSRPFEPKFLTTGPNGVETPQTYGVAFERVTIPRGTRRLDGYLVKASAGCGPELALLIYHGVKETISMWARRHISTTTVCRRWCSTIRGTATAPGRAPLRI
jgi:hypothetical protein